MSIEIANESGVAVDVLRLEQLARFVLSEMRVNPLVELSIRLVDVEAMTALHVHFMNEAGPTDVLAFPMDELHDHRDDVEGGEVARLPRVRLTRGAVARRCTTSRRDRARPPGRPNRRP